MTNNYNYNTNNNNTSGGIGFFGLLTILFVALKLTGFIDWSWWLVFSPLWGPFIAFVVFILIIATADWYLNKK